MDLTVPGPAALRLLAAAGTSLLVLLVAGCAPAAAQPAAGQFSGTPGKLTPVVLATDVAVGKDQRFLLGIIGPDNQLITDAAVEFSFLKVGGNNTAQVRNKVSATMYAFTGPGGGGFYEARTEFDEPGDWGVVAVLHRDGQPDTQVQAGFTVKAHSATPAIGEPVPASHTPTGTTPEQIEAFSSARPVDPSLYRLSIDEALRQHKPLVVVFATPGFCTSRTCGPTVEVLQQLHRQFGDAANFIHVEIYKDAKPPDVVPAVTEWGLPSEPWLFVVGADGRLVDKYEGSITAEEIGPRLAQLLNG